MDEEEQQNNPIIATPPPDMQFNLTPEGEAELAAREEERQEEGQEERHDDEEKRRAVAARARLEAVEQAGRQARALLGSIGTKLEESQSPAGDDLSDLFEGPNPEDNDIYIKDLVSVEEEDVMGDGDPEMRDLLEVDEEAIMGEEEGPTEMHPVRKAASKYVRVRRVPPTGLSGLQS